MSTKRGFILTAVAIATLPSGRTVECVAASDSWRAGISCDWEHAG